MNQEIIMNKFQISFRQHEYDPEIKSFWVGTKIDFSGNNATKLYKIIQQQKFDWDIFDLHRTSLSRFDLSHSNLLIFDSILAECSMTQSSHINHFTCLKMTFPNIFKSYNPSIKIFY